MVEERFDPEVSVVIPAYNEAENLPVLIAEIEAAMASTGLSYEVIVIDDGSTDSTAEVLARQAEAKAWLRPVYFDGNYGQSAGLDAGFRASRGSKIVTLDADLQNDPADIPALLDGLSRADAVFGWRAARRDRWSRRLVSRVANRIRSRVTGDGIRDTGCSLKAFRREAVERIKLFTGMHRFLGTLMKMEGYTVSEVVVNHRPRRFGRSNYHIFNRSIKPMVDLLAVAWMRRRRLGYRIRNGKG